MSADTVGGVWTYALELARALAPRGAAVALATMGAPLSPAQRAEAEAAPNLSLFESAHKLEWMDDPWEEVAAAGEWLLGLERQLRPEVVHLNGYAHAALPWSAPTVVVGHSCVLSWWEAVKGEAAPARWGRYAEAVRRGLRAADLVITPTAAMLHALERHYGPLGEARVIANGRDPARFAPRPKEPFVLSAGRLWDEAKNVAAVAAAARELAWPVLVAGEAARPEGDPDPAGLRLDNLTLLGRLAPAALAEVMGRAAIYALPAHYEPFGLSALEAGLAGCALVLGDIPSLREVWGDAALFVPPADAEALRRALSRLIADDALRDDLARRARARALGYGPSRMARGYLERYSSLARTAHPAPAGLVPTGKEHA